MTIIADTSGIIALLDQSEAYHSEAVTVIQQERLWIPSTILPEVDYLATKYLGERVAQSFLDAVIADYFVYRFGRES